MPEQPSARTFISYSRKDGAQFAADLRKRLLKENFSVWQDLVALEGGRDWWSQIDDALKSKSLQHFVLIVTPAALASPVVRREIRLARQEGKTVSPVRGPGLVDLSALPRWVGQVYDLDLPEHWGTLVRVLQSKSTQERVAMMAPEPPTDFVQRQTEFEAIKKQLLDEKGDSVATTAALRGAGGYGKTTLAKALAHDPDIQDAYFDGILWVELGEKPDNLLAIVSDLVEILTSERPGLESISAAAAKLAEALGDRRILLIVDDVWREQDVSPLLQGGTNTTRLITTRLNRVLPRHAFRQPVDAMTGYQARELLSSRLPEDVRSQSAELGALAARLGEWAQLLRLVNGFLYERVVDGGDFLQQAIVDANDRLTEEGLVGFDAEDEDGRTKAVARTINLSLGLLDKKQRARFGELAIFPEDADIPLGVVARLWQRTGRLSEARTKDLLVKFCGLSLLLDLDLNRRTFRFHDTVRRFLRDLAGKKGLVAQHKSLLLALGAVGTSAKADALTRRYYYLHLPQHLAEAGERDRLDALLLDPGWLQEKLAETGNPHALVADYETYGTNETQDFIGRTLRLTAGICARDQRQLIPHLLGRLMACESRTMLAFLTAARRRLIPPAFLPQRRSLTPPGAESARLEGHAGYVMALCVLSDGRLISGSYDGTIRLWDVRAGVESARLKGPAGSVRAICILPDGRLASGSDDNTIRLWDVKTGAESGRLEGHAGHVRALCVLPDGRLVSGSDDNTIRLWDVKTGAENGRLEGHAGRVMALYVLPDGRLASGSDDNTIRLWNVRTCVESARLGGHADSINALCLLPDGRLASGSDDNTIRLWDARACAESARLEGHADSINALCLLPDGRLASGSYDNTIRLWDMKTGAETARLEGHAGGVMAMCTLPGGRLASGSSDNTIRLWDVETGAENARPEGHADSINALCVPQGERLASASHDNTIRLWDAKTGAERTRLEGHVGWIRALCVLPEGRLASGSYDNTIRLWDVKTGEERARLEGHTDGVIALCVLPDGRLASGSADHTIRLWDVRSGAESALLEGHARGVMALCVLPDGRLASSSADRTIRLWNVKTDTERSGVESALLEGHTSYVMALCVLPDGRLASGSSDNTIRLWDLKTNAECARLEGGLAWVHALCVLPDGRLASGSSDSTVRLWDMKTGVEREIIRLEVDAPVLCLAALPDGRLVAGDQLGRLHWLEIVE